jgi:hypothetical protein
MTDKKSQPPAADAEPLPTVRDHIERLTLARWQSAALMARLCGEHVDGVRRFPDGVSLNTRMTVEEFDAAVQVLTQGRV